jgi:hypothetical protein
LEKSFAQAGAHQWPSGTIISIVTNRSSRTARRFQNAEHEG